MRTRATSIKRKDEDKTWEELLLEVKSLRGLAAGQQEAIARYKDISRGSDTRLRDEVDASGAGGVHPGTFALLADASAAGIMVYQGEDTVYVNQAMADLEGYTLEERRRRKFCSSARPRRSRG